MARETRRSARECGQRRQGGRRVPSGAEICDRRDDEIRIQTRQAAELIRAAYPQRRQEGAARSAAEGRRRLPENDQQAFRTIEGVTTCCFGPSARACRNGSSSQKAARALLRRVDVLAATSAPLCFVSLVQGNALNVQAVWHAVRSGEPEYLVMALTGVVGARVRQRNAFRRTRARG